MAYVYMLQGSNGRFYIGASEDPETRLSIHNAGRVHSTRRLGLPLTMIAKRKFSSMTEAVTIERKLKSWKNPEKSQAFLQEA